MEIMLFLQVLVISAFGAQIIIWAFGDRIEQRYRDEHPVRRFCRLTLYFALPLLAIVFLSTR